ncbi:YqgQ family protein [Vagococcus sp. DIV0080]|uniref:YqgQ family protein n=1 Tax=Candidatus Vagococcus giribetii TaxID=2230876 RepID=A0ABS3HTM4_9ENTE|nr:YqgQ family protein [Vagococcus sp. DIV0080]MBO0477102.1 YqgQ family protein [Vagococcus sp. DIV0080]
MRTMYDVQQLLKQFGTFIYVGNRLWDIEMMQIEIRELYDSGVIERQVFLNAMMVLKKEHQDELEYQEGLN